MGETGFNLFNSGSDCHPGGVSGALSDTNSAKYVPNVLRNVRFSLLLGY
jgi:hypothetical protein